MTASLRGAISNANTAAGNDTVTFDPVVFAASQTIALLTSELSLTNNGSITITGPGANLLTVQRSTAGGTPDFRIFYVNTGATAVINGLTIANGSVTGSFPAGSGAGIFNDKATLTINNSTVRNNTAVDFGGGIYNSSGSLMVNSSSIRDNSSTSESGGGIGSRTTGGASSLLTIKDSTMSANFAFGGRRRHPQQQCRRGQTPPRPSRTARSAVIRPYQPPVLEIIRWRNRDLKPTNSTVASNTGT